MKVSSLFSYFLNTQNEHGLHSPFVYDLYLNVIKNQVINDNVVAIESIREKMLKSKEQIAITDYGAGSKINQSNLRQISDIAKNSKKSPRLGQLFQRLIQRFNHHYIFDLGTSLGLTTMYLQTAHPNTKVYTFEGCPETAKIAQQNFEELRIEAAGRASPLSIWRGAGGEVYRQQAEGSRQKAQELRVKSEELGVEAEGRTSPLFPNALGREGQGTVGRCREVQSQTGGEVESPLSPTLIIGNIDYMLAPVIDAVPQIDFAFFDANHRYEPTVRYFETCLLKAHNDSIFVFDDIHWSDEMEQAWEYIKKHPSVSVTIDLFAVGLVFFRKEQPKQNFVLRWAFWK